MRSSSEGWAVYFIAHRIEAALAGAYRLARARSLWTGQNLGLAVHVWPAWRATLRRTRRRSRFGQYARLLEAELPLRRAAAAASAVAESDTDEESGF